MTREINYKISVSFALKIRPENLIEYAVQSAIEKELKHKYPRLISICNGNAIDFKEYNAHCIPGLTVPTDICEAYDTFPTSDILFRQASTYITEITVSLTITPVQDDDLFTYVLTEFSQIKLFKRMRRELPGALAPWDESSLS